jgi:Transcriptional accessory protein
MDQTLIKSLTNSLNLSAKTIATVLSLLEENTVPFIARYRKEQTGDLDETTIRAIAHEYESKKNLKTAKPM